jgi:carboxypeptidase family protein/TonB-dependent receptor-like protein
MVQFVFFWASYRKAGRGCCQLQFDLDEGGVDTMKRLALAILVVLSLAVRVNAQTFRGAINGTVTDPSGSVVPNAAVKATEAATGIDHNTVTTSEGQFAIQDIPLGFYKVTVTATGFPAYTVDKVEVAAGTIYTLNVKLTLQQQTTTVEVSAAALTLDTTTQVETTTISPDIVQDVPLNGRDFTQLIQVAPGYAGYSVGGFGSLNGTRPNQMDWQIDGVDNNDFWHNIPAVNQGGVSGIAGVVLPVDAIDEFSARTQSNAEAGRNAGGTVNVVLKSGGNDIHGSAYFYWRNEYFSNPSPFFCPGSNPNCQSTDPTKAPRLRNENYGFTVGGPIIKNKFFYFLGYEKQEYIIGLSGVATEPSQKWVDSAATLLKSKAVPASSISCNMLGALAAGPVGSTVCPGVTGTTQGLWPISGPASILSLAGTTSNFFSSSPSTGYSYNSVVKLDYNFSEKHHLSARMFNGEGSQIAPLGTSTALAVASSNLPFYFERAPIHVQNYTIVENSTYTPTLSNQILFGVNYFNQTFRDANASFDTVGMGLVQSPSALKNGKPIFGAPNIAIIPVSGNGGFEQVGITPPEGRNDITGMLADIVSYNRGKHQLRFGGEMRQGHVNEFYYRHSLGFFSFNGSQGPWPACSASDVACQNTNALADFLAGDVASSSLTVGNAERTVTVNALSFFGADQWQLTRKLNVNLGLRWEYFGPLHNGSKDLAEFIPGKGVVVQGNGISDLFPGYKKNFAPRLGFAYQAKNDLVVRGSFGIYYDQINMNPFLDYRPPNSGADGLEDNPAGPKPVSLYSTPFCGVNGTGGYQWSQVQQSTCPAGYTNGGKPNPTKSIYPGVVTCASGVNSLSDPGCANGPFGLYSIAQNFRPPYFYNFNLQVEKSLGSAAVFQVGYVGSTAHHLSVMLNINQAPLSGVGGRPFATPYPAFGDINQLNSIGNSNYHSLQSTLKIRSWHGLNSQFSYTWGHELDFVTEYRGTLVLDSTNLRAEYGNGDFDTRNSFSASLVYDVPKAPWAQSTWSKQVFNGWQLSSLWILHGGQPFNITGNTNRPGLNVIGNPFAGVSHTFSNANGPSATAPIGEPWVNPAAFCTPGAAGCPGTTSPLGDLSRNKYYGPSFRDIDFSIFKNFPITERVKVQLRGEIYNLFNRINLASGAGSVNGSGVVTDTIGDFNGAPGLGPGEPRNAQLVAKIIF